MDLLTLQSPCENSEEAAQIVGLDDLALTLVGGGGGEVIFG